MIRFVSLLVILEVFALCSYGSSPEHMDDKDLTEVMKMKGVEIVCRRGDLSESFSPRTWIPGDSKDLFGFSLGLLQENDLLGKQSIEQSKITPRHKPTLKAVELFGIDPEGRKLFVAPLQFRELQGGYHFRELTGNSYIWILFTIDKRLMERSFIRIVESVGFLRGGTQWTDVYLGSKPGTPPERVAARLKEIEAQPEEGPPMDGLEPPPVAE